LSKSVQSHLKTGDLKMSNFAPEKNLYPCGLCTYTLVPYALMSLCLVYLRLESGASLISLSVHEPVRITISIAVGCKVRCLRCQDKIVLNVVLNYTCGNFTHCRLGIELFAQPHNEPAIRKGSEVVT
jgi:hypothetical protein